MRKLAFCIALLAGIDSPVQAEVEDQPGHPIQATEGAAELFQSAVEWVRDSALVEPEVDRQLREIERTLGDLPVDGSQGELISVDRYELNGVVDLRVAYLGRGSNPVEAFARRGRGIGRARPTGLLYQPAESYMVFVRNSPTGLKRGSIVYPFFVQVIEKAQAQIAQQAKEAAAAGAKREAEARERARREAEERARRESKGGPTRERDPHDPPDRPRPAEPPDHPDPPDPDPPDPDPPDPDPPDPDPPDPDPPDPDPPEIIHSFLNTEEFGEVAVAVALVAPIPGQAYPSVSARSTTEGLLLSLRTEPSLPQAELASVAMGSESTTGSEEEADGEIEVRRTAQGLSVLSRPTPGVQAFDWGTDRYWVDFNSDGVDDFCRAIQDAKVRTGALECTLANGPTMDLRYGGRSYRSRVSYAPGPRWARLWWKVNDNEWLDFCTLAEDEKSARCLLDPGINDQILTVAVVPGAPGARGWADLDGDRVPEFCSAARRPDGRADLACTSLLSGARVAVADVDVGKGDLMLWVDVNFDGRTDFCSVDGSRTFLQCLLSDGKTLSVVVRDLLDRSVDGGQVR